MKKLALVICLAAVAGCIAAVARPHTAHASAPALHTQMVAQINQIRRAHGLKPLMESQALWATASKHSQDMIARDYFAHTSPTGSTLADRITASGFVRGFSWGAGETIAWGSGSYASVEHTASAWMNSPEHRAIILTPGYQWIGVSRACAVSPRAYEGYKGACVWTADFVVRH